MTESIVVVSENGRGKYQQSIIAGSHEVVADEPLSAGGDDAGLNPYELLLASLGACTAMTLRMYADLKKLPLKKVSVTLQHEKIHAADCADCETKDGKIDRILRIINLDGPLSDDQRKKLLEIADKCPVHRTLHSEIRIVTRVSE